MDKKILKLLAFITLAAVLAFELVGCGSESADHSISFIGSWKLEISGWVRQAEFFADGTMTYGASQLSGSWWIENDRLSVSIPRTAANDGLFDGVYAFNISDDGETITLESATGSAGRLTRTEASASESLDISSEVSSVSVDAHAESEGAPPKPYDWRGEYGGGLWQASKDGLYGLIDDEDNIVIDFQYEAVGIYDYGLIPAKKGGYWGVVDRNNQQAVPFMYDELYSSFVSSGDFRGQIPTRQIRFRLGYIAASLNGATGVLAADGTFLVPLSRDIGSIVHFGEHVFVETHQPANSMIATIRDWTGNIIRENCSILGLNDEFIYINGQNGFEIFNNRGEFVFSPAIRFRGTTSAAEFDIDYINNIFVTGDRTTLSVSNAFGYTGDIVNVFEMGRGIQAMPNNNYSVSVTENGVVIYWTYNRHALVFSREPFGKLIFSMYGGPSIGGSTAVWGDDYIIVFENDRFAPGSTYVVNFKTLMKSWTFAGASPTYHENALIVQDSNGIFYGLLVNDELVADMQYTGIEYVDSCFVLRQGADEKRISVGQDGSVTWLEGQADIARNIFTESVSSAIGQ